MRNNLTFILIYSIATLFLGGCNSVSKEVYPRYADFPEVRTLSQVKAISCDSVYLRYPYRVEIKDSLAVILDLHPESSFFTHLPIRIGSMLFHLAGVAKALMRFFLPSVSVSFLLIPYGYLIPTGDR